MATAHAPNRVTRPTSVDGRQLSSPSKRGATLHRHGNLDRSVVITHKTIDQGPRIRHPCRHLAAVRLNLLPDLLMKRNSLPINFLTLTSVKHERDGRLSIFFFFIGN